MGRPEAAWARIAGSSPSRSMAFAIVVLSPPGNHEPVEVVQLLGRAHLDRGRAQRAKHRRMGREVALARQHANPERGRPPSLGRRRSVHVH